MIRTPSAVHGCHARSAAVTNYTRMTSVCGGVATDSSYMRPMWRRPISSSSSAIATAAAAAAAAAATASSSSSPKSSCGSGCRGDHHHHHHHHNHHQHHHHHRHQMVDDNNDSNDTDNGSDIVDSHRDPAFLKFLSSSPSLGNAQQYRDAQMRWQEAVQGMLCAVPKKRLTQHKRKKRRSARNLFNAKWDYQPYGTCSGCGRPRRCHWLCSFCKTLPPKRVWVNPYLNVPKR